MVARNPISRKDLTNQQWQRLQPLLPQPNRKGGRPAKEHRTVINGILWILRTGAPIALRAFKKGETYQTNTGLGKPYQDAFMLGANGDSGNSFWRACNREQTPQASLTESSILSMVV